VLSDGTTMAGETIRITYNRKIYDIDVVDVKPRDHGARPRHQSRVALLWNTRVHAMHMQDSPIAPTALRDRSCICEHACAPDAHGFSAAV
jgi:hypothetical protein